MPTKETETIGIDFNYNVIPVEVETLTEALFCYLKLQEDLIVYKTQGPLVLHNDVKHIMSTFVMDNPSLDEDFKEIADHVREHSNNNTIYFYECRVSMGGENVIKLARFAID